MQNVVLFSGDALVRIDVTSNATVAYAAALTGSSGRIIRYGRIASRCDGRCRYKYVHYAYVGHTSDRYVSERNAVGGNLSLYIAVGRVTV